MRAGYLVVGILLILLGAVLAFVPIITSASASLDDSTPAWGANITAAFSITGTVPLQVSWSSSSTVTISAETCSSISGGATCQDAALQTQNGTSGTFNLAPKTNGGVIVFLPSGGSASVTVKEAQTTIGAIALILGVLLFLVGLVLRSKRSRPPVQPAPPVNPPT